MKTFPKHCLLLVALAAPFTSASCAKPAPRASSKAPKAGARKAASPKAAPLRLRRHAFPDVTMGVPVAYTAILPVGWKAQGKVEWKPVGAVPFPQQAFEIESPLGGQVSFEPSATFSYMEAPGMAPQGVPAPADFPRWLPQALASTESKMSNVKLVSSKRDAKAEAFMAGVNQATGGGNGMQVEVWNVVLDYDEGGAKRRGEANITYTRLAPYVSQNMSSQMWSVAPSLSISAPASQFAAQRKALLGVASTVRPTPLWHVQSQGLIAEMSRQRTAASWQAIRDRGRQIGKLTDDVYAQFKKDMARGDAAQRQRINGIYETDDFRDTTGSVVNLPMHYQHVFSDGKGNYVLSNDSGAKPGELWTSIRPMK